MKITVWALLAAAAAAQGLFLSAALFSKKENQPANRLLGFLLLLLAVTLLEWGLLWTGGMRQVPYLIGMGAAFPLLFGPVLWRYYGATFEKRPWRASHSLHLLPFFLYLVFMLPFYFRFVKPATAALDWNLSIRDYPWIPLLIFGQMIAYSFWIPLRFRQHFKENKELRHWHRWLLAGYWGIVAAYLFYRLLGVFGWQDPAWQYVVAGGQTFFIYLVAWLGYIEPRVLAGLPLREAAKPVKYGKSSLDRDQSARLFEKISSIVDQEQLFRIGHLTLETLSEKTGAPRHHVSQAINEQSGGSFPELINSLRIREAQRLLSHMSKQEMNVIEVAYHVGFNNKKAFNAAFKKCTGMTPTEFRKQQKLPS